MIKVIDHCDEFSSGSKKARMEIAIGSTAELVTEYGGVTLTDGSIAWVISTGEFYGLLNGIWYNQDGSGALGSNVQQSRQDTAWKNSQGEETNASLNASVSDNTRQLSEPVPDSTKAAEATENEPETIDEVTEPITFDKEIESDGTGEIMEEIPEKTSFIEDASVGDENALRDTESR